MARIEFRVCLLQCVRYCDANPMSHTLKAWIQIFEFQLKKLLPHLFFTILLCCLYNLILCHNEPD